MVLLTGLAMFAFVGLPVVDSYMRKNSGSGGNPVIAKYGGKELTHSGVVDQSRILPYRASTRDCARCTLKSRCTNAKARKVSRDIDEDVRDHVRALAGTPAFEQSRNERKKVEMRFAHMKRIHKLERFRLRGLGGVKDEVLLTATAQNLKRLAKFAWKAHTPQAAAA